MASDELKALGQTVKQLSGDADIPLDQADELTGLLAQVAESDAVPEPLVEVLSRVLEFLYSEDSNAAQNPPEK